MMIPSAEAHDKEITSLIMKLIKEIKFLYSQLSEKEAKENEKLLNDVLDKEEKILVHIENPQKPPTIQMTTDGRFGIIDESME